MRNTVSRGGMSACAEEKERCIRLAEFLIENKSTVRATAKHFGISKSTVHKDLTEKLPHISASLSDEARAVMAQNKAERHLRGGQATRIKYRALRRSGIKKNKDPEVFL